MTAKEMPLVSVIIPTYKRPDKLDRAIESVLCQTYKAYEIIVIDDNNPNTEDRLLTEKCMEKYKSNEHIKYIKHDKNRNGSAARNTGIKYSKGKYIMLLDDDDEFLPEKMKAQVLCMEARDNSWGACYTRYYDIDLNGRVVMTCAEKREGKLLIEELKRNLFVHAGSNLMIRKSIVEEIGGFNERFIRNQDVEFLVRILKKYKLAYVPVWGLKVYKHNEKRSTSYDELTRNYLSAFQKEISSLDEKSRSEVLLFIDLQTLRNRLQSSGHQIDGIKMIFERKMPIRIVAKYCFHLLSRRITKTAYGFKL